MTVQIFVIDGPDGVGKTTLINKLVSYFNQSTSYKAVSLSNSRTALGIEVKRLLNTFNLSHQSEISLILSTLHDLAHVIHDDYIIDDLLAHPENEVKTIIFLDRWVSSTGVYQRYAYERMRGNIVEPLWFEQPIPHIDVARYLILDTEDSVMDKRLQERKVLEKFEESETFRRYVREGFRKLKNYNLSSYSFLNVTEDYDDNYRKVLTEILKYLK